MNQFIRYFRNKTDVLSAKFSQSSEIEHSGTVGTEREVFLKEALNELYPERYIFSEGEIIDYQGTTSPQADIVVYDDHMPVLSHAAADQFLSEGVLAHIEVKSDLSTQLEDALNKSARVKELERDIQTIMQVGNIPSTVPSFVFSFDGPSKKTFKNNIIDFYESKKVRPPDYICVLDQYTCGYNGKFFFQDTGSDSLLAFIIQLADFVFKNWIGTPNFQNYYAEVSAEPF